MKRTYIAGVTILLFAGILGLSSCLKDDDSVANWTQQIENGAFVELPAGGSVAKSKSLQPIAGDQKYNFEVALAVMNAPATDIKAKLIIDQAALDAYNKANNTSFKLYPTATLAQSEVTIPAGSKVVATSITMTGADKLNACDNFMVPISISESSFTISGNFKTIYLRLPLSNPFQGTYKATGEFIHPTGGTRVINQDKTLATVNCSTVSTTIGDLSTAQGTLTLKVNADNTVSVDGTVSVAGDVDPDPNQANTYDPATKTFTLHYFYPGAGGNRVINEVLVRK
ncbi:MAG TPA: DUF1735 domain-containing protein [Phnomibacter sp.]|nr:DUF1735 domain-containing protein [Phnomibacter sp.]